MFYPQNSKKKYSSYLQNYLSYLSEIHYGQVMLAAQISSVKWLVKLSFILQTLKVCEQFFYIVKTYFQSFLAQCTFCLALTDLVKIHCVVINVLWFIVII